MILKGYMTVTVKYRTKETKSQRVKAQDGDKKPGGRFQRHQAPNSH